MNKERMCTSTMKQVGVPVLRQISDSNILIWKIRCSNFSSCGMGGGEVAKTMYKAQVLCISLSHGSCCVFECGILGVISCHAQSEWSGVGGRS